jgi:hypothetical protein
MANTLVLVVGGAGPDRVDPDLGPIWVGGPCYLHRCQGHPGRAESPSLDNGLVGEPDPCISPGSSIRLAAPFLRVLHVEPTTASCGLSPDVRVLIGWLGLLLSDSVTCRRGTCLTASEM